MDQAESDSEHHWRRMVIQPTTEFVFHFGAYDASLALTQTAVDWFVSCCLLKDISWTMRADYVSQEGKGSFVELFFKWETTLHVSA